MLGLLAVSMTSCSQKSRGLIAPKGKITHVGTMRPYCVFGKRYTPTNVRIGQTMIGISSWYGPNFHGKQTSSGERYDMYTRTAAHKTWPMGTVVKVTNLENGRNTVVRINDRGPFVHGRILDCSYKAGRDLGLDKTGIARVKLEVLGFTDNKQLHTLATKHEYNKDISSKTIMPDTMLQVGAFRHYEGAVLCQRQYARHNPRYKVIIEKTLEANSVPLYRVKIAGFRSKQEKEDFVSSIYRSNNAIGSNSI